MFHESGYIKRYEKTLTEDCDMLPPQMPTPTLSSNICLEMQLLDEYKPRDLRQVLL